MFSSFSSKPNTDMKLLVTGLGIGADVDPDICWACNIDLVWMFEHPSAFLWADKIVVTKLIDKHLSNPCWPKEPSFSGFPAIANVKTICYELAKEWGLIEVKEAGAEISENLKTAVRNEVEGIQNSIAEMHPKLASLNSEPDVPGSMVLNGYSYCYPKLLSLHYSMLLAETWNAYPLLDPSSKNYFTFVDGLRSKKHDLGNMLLRSFETLFSCQLPEVDIMPYDGSRTCWTCKRLGECEFDQLKQIEVRFRTFLDLRRYDELHQMKEFFSKVVSKVDLDTLRDYEKDLAIEFERRKKALLKPVRKFHPNIVRWSNMVSMLSIPAVSSSYFLSSSPVATVIKATAGLFAIPEKYNNMVEKKRKWLSFRQESIPSLRPQLPVVRDRSVEN